MLAEPYEHAEYVRKLVDQAPPLTEAQRAQLAVLLRPAPLPTVEVDQREAA